MEGKTLKSGFLLAQSFILRAVDKAFSIKLDGTALNVLQNDKKGDYQTAFGNMLFNKYKASNEEVKKLETPLKLMQHMKAVMDEMKEPIFEKVDVNDKAFMFLKFNKEYLEDVAKQILTDGIHLENPHGAKNIAIDFSSPNVAKEMHVGHLRSTIMGESICRIMEFMGHKVHRINHIGDWGTQFGMLICHMFDEYPDYLQKLPDLKDLESFYIAAKKRFDSDPEFKKRSQETVVKLQSGDADCHKAWTVICDISRGFFVRIYKRLDITNNEFGESFYNPMIPELIKELESKNLIKVDKGAKCLYLEGKDVPLMVQKTDGGYGYDTTDLAAVNYRLKTLGVDRAIYLTDVGQFPHFDLIFRAAFLAGWAIDGQHRLDHMGFGLVQNEDGGKMKTRDGGNIKLMELLDEAKARAKKQIVERLTGEDHDDEHEGDAKDKKGGQKGKKGEKEAPKEEIVEKKAAPEQTPEAASTCKLTEDQIEEASELMGIDAIKYFDLNQNRVQNYKFSYDKMLSPKGNTAVYLLYSYARINSIIEKSGISLDKLKDISTLKVTDEYELMILAHVAKFCEVLLGVADELNINRLCAYLYDLSCIIASGYKKYKILGNEHTHSRVQILLVTQMVFDRCFFLLGLKTLKKI
jgi:arginyl-tRNA synthetase